MKIVGSVYVYAMLREPAAQAALTTSLGERAKDGAANPSLAACEMAQFWQWKLQPRVAIE